MDKYQQEPDEIVRRKGDLSYYQGEASLKNALTGKFKVTECTAFLTSKRLVVCRKRKYFPWGWLVWLIIVMRRRKIVFVIPLQSMARIAWEPPPSKRMVFCLKTAEGAAYDVAAIGFIGDNKGKWIAAIKEAVTAAFPATNVTETAGLVEFTRAGAG
jgi:hypothetical protein